MIVARVYLVSGKAKLQSGVMRFKLYVPAVKPRDAVERAYELIGSRHKAKRFQVIIENVEEVPLEKAPDNLKQLGYMNQIIVY